MNSVDPQTVFFFLFHLKFKFSLGLLCISRTYSSISHVFNTVHHSARFALDACAHRCPFGRSSFTDALLCLRACGNIRAPSCGWWVEKNKNVNSDFATLLPAGLKISRIFNGCLRNLCCSANQSSSHRVSFTQGRWRRSLQMESLFGERKESGSI